MYVILNRGLGLWCLTPLSTIFVILWRSVLLVKESKENHRPAARNRQTLSHNGVSSTPSHELDSSSQLAHVVVNPTTQTITTTMVPAYYIAANAVN